MQKALALALTIALGGGLSACSPPDVLPFVSEDTSTSVAGDPVDSTTTGQAPSSELALPPSLAESTPATTTTAPATTAPTTTAPTTTAPTTTAPTTAPPTTVSPHPPGVLVIGDSILEGLNVLNYSFGPNTVFDTEVSRSSTQLQAVLDSHEPPANVVVHLGTNGWWPDAGIAFSEAFAQLEGRRVILVNLRVDRAYTALANAEIAEVANANDNVTLINWDSAATPGLLRSDGYHPNLDGYEVLARLIADALGLPAGTDLQPGVVPAPGAGDADGVSGLGVEGS